MCPTGKMCYFIAGIILFVNSSGGYIKDMKRESRCNPITSAFIFVLFFHVIDTTARRVAEVLEGTDKTITSQ